MVVKRNVWIISVLSGLVMAGCADVQAPTGAELYRENCAGCHGATGDGTGRNGRALPIPPSNLRLLAHSNGGVFPAEQVMATIYGYRGKDHNGLMPEFGPVLDSPDVIWTAPDGREVPTPALLLALSDYLQTIQDP